MRALSFWRAGQALHLLPWLGLGPVAGGTPPLLAFLLRQIRRDLPVTVSGPGSHRSLMALQTFYARLAAFHAALVVLVLCVLSRGTIERIVIFSERAVNIDPLNKRYFLSNKTRQRVHKVVYIIGYF